MIIDVIQFIIDSAEAQGWKPILADSNSINYELTQQDVTDSVKFLFIRDDSFTMEKTGQFYNGDITYSVGLMLCRKWEEETVSSIEETYAQKYDNRIKELKEDMIKFLGDYLYCSNDVELMTNKITPIKNVFSLSADGVNCDLTFRTWNQYDD
jgi:hypothetical protein